MMASTSSSSSASRPCITSDYEEAGTITGPDSPPRKKVKRHHVDSKYQPEWSRKYRIVFFLLIKH